MKKKCLVCGKSFEPVYYRRKYCSEKCRKTAWAKSSRDFYYRKKENQHVLKKKCAHCGKEFETTRDNKKYCNEECRYKGRLLAMAGYRLKKREKPVIKKVCEYCGTEFETKNPERKSCSKECSIKLMIGGLKKTAAKPRASTLEENMRCADECGLSYGNYIGQLRMGKTYEELFQLQNRKQ